MVEVSCDWLKDVRGRNGVVVSDEPAVQQFEAFGVFAQFGQKNFKQFLRNETRKSSVTVPVPQQSLWSRDTGNENNKNDNDVILNLFFNPFQL